MYVIAGITGRVGSVAASALLNAGKSVRGIFRDRSRSAPWQLRSVDAAVGSLDDPSFLTRALDGAAGFFTLLPENVSPDDFHGSRRRIADSIVSAVADSGVAHVVMLSAVPAVLPDGNGPAKDLHYLENRLRASAERLTVLRACYFQDNVAGAIPAAATAGIFTHFMPSADTAVPMIAARDVGRFAASALVDPPARHETIDLFGPAYSMRQVADHLGAALGKPLQVVGIPPAEHVTTLERAGVPRQLAEGLAEMFAAFGTGRIAPAGDRRLTATTGIDTVIAECVARQKVGM